MCPEIPGRFFHWAGYVAKTCVGDPQSIRNPGERLFGHSASESFHAHVQWFLSKRESILVWPLQREENLSLDLASPNLLL